MIRHKDYLLVQVPEDAKDFAIHSLHDYDKLVFSSTIQDPLNCGGDMLILPPGTWQLIGLASELTEEQWREIVEMQFNENWMPGDDIDQTIGYKDYTDSENYVPTRIESGQSLLRSHNLNASTTVILKLIQP